MEPSENPFQPPSSHEDGGRDRTGQATDASRWARLAAQVIDGLILIAVFVPVAIYGLGMDFDRPTEHTADQQIVVSLIGLCLHLLLHSWLWYHRSASIGKALLRLRIETLDGRPAGFARIVVARVLPGFLVALLPFGNGPALIDALFVFRRDRRCLHDLIAGTRVMKLARAARG